MKAKTGLVLMVVVSMLGIQARAAVIAFDIKADQDKKFIKMGAVEIEDYTVQVVTDQAEALYSTGDPVVFTATLEKEGVLVSPVAVQIVLTRDGAETINPSNLTVAGTTLIVEGTLGQPGFLRCQATHQLPSGKTISALAGAGFNPEQIQPSLPAPADFDTFWADQLALLDAVPMNVTMVSINSGNPLVEAFDVTIDCLGDKPVRAYVAWPIDAQPAFLPALISFHGAGVRSCYTGTMVAKAAEGILTMVVNAHGIDNTCRPTSVYAAYNKLSGMKEILNFPLMGHEWHSEILDHFMVQFWEEVAARAE